MLSGRRTSNTDDTVSSGITRQQSTNNATDNIAKGGRNEQLENSKQSSFLFPTNEQLQATDNKKISEDVNALNLEDKLYKTMYKIYLIMKSCHKTQAIMYQNCHRMKWIY